MTVKPIEGLDHHTEASGGSAAQKEVGVGPSLHLHCHIKHIRDLCGDRPILRIAGKRVCHHGAKLR